MKVTIKELEYLECNSDIIYLYDGPYKRDIIKSIYSTSLVEKTHEFSIKETFAVEGLEIEYAVIQNEIGTFIARADNLIIIEEAADTLERLGIKRIIKSGDKTILITNYNEKFITTRNKVDKDDIEKAVAFLLLKSEGYSIEDFYTVVNSVQTQSRKGRNEQTENAQDSAM